MRTDNPTVDNQHTNYLPLQKPADMEVVSPAVWRNHISRSCQKLGLPENYNLTRAVLQHILVDDNHKVKVNQSYMQDSGVGSRGAEGRLLLLRQFLERRFFVNVFN